MKKTIKIIIIVAVVAVIAVGATLGGIFGTISASAKGSVHYDKVAAENIAKDFLAESLHLADTTSIITTDYDYDVEPDRHLNQSYYVHEFELRVIGTHQEYDIYVNAKTGEPTFFDYNFD